MKQTMITVAALGPDSAQLLTLGAIKAMKQADALVLRTARHAAADFLKEEGVAFDTLDALYEECEDFDELCEMAAAQLIATAREKGSLCYAVSEPVSDATVRALVAALPEDVGVQVLGGVTLTQGAACAAIAHGVNTENLRTITALSIDALRPQADTAQVITEIDTRYIASDVKLWLSDLFEDEMTVYFLPDAAQPGAAALPIALCDLDRQAHYDHRTAVLVPAVSVYERSRATFEDFIEVITRLRGPDGCPWDRAQTHHTLRQYMIEEACEAAEAMEEGEPMKIADELGDVLLQVVLNSCIGAEHRDFTDRDVTSMAAHKMITRHAHVFGRETANSAGEVTGLWEKMKMRERGEQTALERVMDVPVSLPALMRAQKSIKRELGAKGKTLEAREALAQLEAAVSAMRVENAGEEALGALLERVCALAHAMGLDAETALRAATLRQIERLKAEKS